MTKAKNIKPKDRVSFSVKKKTNLSDLFGKLKIKKKPQELKDESRG